MPKARTKTSRTKKENDPLDISDQIFIKEEKINEIKKEVLDLDIDIFPVSVNQLELKKEVEDCSNDLFLVDPKDIPGIEKIVNIEDILKNNFNSTDSTNLSSSKNVNNDLQNSKTSPAINSSVSRDSTSRCNCMQHIQHYCCSCDVVTTYKADTTECAVCKTVLKLQCSKCSRKYKFLNSTRQYLLQYSKQLNLLSNEKKGIVLKCQKQVNFCCSVCSLKTKSKEQFDQHVKTHSVDEKAKQNDHSNDIKQDNCDDDFIEIHCTKCFKTKKNLSYSNRMTYSCKECQEIMHYRCTFCKKLYKSLINIRPHISFNCQKRIEHFKFHCDHCYFKTEDKSKLELHITKVHIPVSCEHCKKEFVNSGALKQHNTKGCPVAKSKTKTEIEQLEVQNCNDESSCSTPWREEGCYEIVQHHPDVLYNDISRKLPKDLYPSSCWQSMIDYYCLSCGEQTHKKFSKYKPWCKKCNTKYEYKCKICGKLYNGPASITNHVKSECPTRYSLACNLCDFTSTQKKVLKTHVKNKHTVYKCLQCESRYHGYFSLKRHLQYNCLIKMDKYLQRIIALYCKQCCNRIINFVGPSLKPCIKCGSIMNFECLKCNQLFNNLEVAQKHVKSEFSPQFNCTKCNYKTYSKYELDIHTRHAHPYKRKCPDCGVFFRDVDIFQRHRLEELRRNEEKKKLLCKQGAKRIKLTN